MLKEKTNLLAPLCGRITPRQVLEAYEATGLIPGTGRFYDDGRACALGAIAAVGMRPTDDWGKVFARIRLDRDYMDSFINGFDNNFLRRLSFPSRAARKGYRDGARARRFVFGEQDTGGGG